jgi:hypothetical protein
MKKVIIKVLVVLTIAGSLSFGAEESKPLLAPTLPTIFFLSREGNPYLSTLPNGEKATTTNVSTIVAAALKLTQIQSNPPEAWENIIILDEGEYWFVSFHARGNGNLQPANMSGYFLMNFNGGIYLDKKTLLKASKIPARPIRSLPMISPLADKVMAPGYIASP